MAEAQPPTIVEGATTGDVEDEVQVPKAAEDRKTAAALSSLDAPRDDEQNNTKDVDQEAVKKAMSRLTGSTEVKKSVVGPKEVKKVVKVDQADVALLVEQLDLTKPKATELLKSHDGDVMKTLRAYVTSSA